MTVIDLDKLIEISNLAAKVKEARLNAERVKSEFDKADSILRALDGELRAAIIDAGLEIGEPDPARAKVQAPQARPWSKRLTWPVPDGKMQQLAYAKRLGYQETKGIKSLKSTGAIPSDAIDKDGYIDVAKADAGIIAAFAKGRCKERAAQGVRLAQAKERGGPVGDDSQAPEPSASDGGEDQPKPEQEQVPVEAPQDPKPVEPEPAAENVFESVQAEIVESVSEEPVRSGPLLGVGSGDGNAEGMSWSDSVDDAIEVLISHGIIVSGGMDGLWSVDEPGKPLRRNVRAPALIWKANQLSGVDGSKAA